LLCPWAGQIAVGQCQMVKLIAPEGNQNQGFGVDVSVSGTTLAVGAHGTPGGGGVFIYEGGSWDPVFVQPGLNSGSFGRSLSLSADRLLVGAPYNDAFGEAAGLAYVYVRSDADWSQHASFAPGDIQPEDRFGWTVDLDGDFAIVGTPYALAAWVFRFDGQNWVEEGRLFAPAGDFAASVAIGEGIAVVGAPDDSTQGLYAGAAFVFERSDAGSWLQTAKLLPLQGYPFRSFGGSVAIDAGTIVIGAEGDGQGAGLPGSAYVFEKNAAGDWYQVAELTDPNALVHDQIGFSVAIDGNTVIVGARQYHEPNGPSTGGAYVFTRDAAGLWSMAGLLLAADGDTDDWFGNAVAVSGNLAVIGAPRDEPFGPWSGSAYVFAVGPDNDGDGVMDACVCTGDINGDWAVDQSDLGLLVSDYGGVPDDPAADLDGDGWIGQTDLGILLANYGRVCP